MNSRKIHLVGHVARIGDVRNVYRILTGKSEGKKALGTRNHI
jgi:hypothetical protein